MANTPYPRDEVERLLESSKRSERAWHIYRFACMLIVLGCFVLMTNPLAGQFIDRDVLLLLLSFGFGFGFRAWAKHELMGLRGLTKRERRSVGAILFWLPWFRRLPERQIERSFEDPPEP